MNYQKIISKIILVLIFVSFADTAAATLFISEVYPDPISTDSGGEFIEIFNNGTQDINLKDYYISTKSSVKDATLPDIMIRAKSNFLIADTTFSQNKDNPNWPNADYEESLTLANTDAGVALKYGNTTIDAIGWGNPSNIGAGLYKGTPVQNPPSGKSLRRISFNGDNSLDFELSDPDPKKGGSSGFDITLNVVVLSSSLVTKVVIKADDDNIAPGIQIVPIPGSTRQVDIEVESSCNPIISFDDKSIPMSAINSTHYKGEIGISYLDRPGEYVITAACGGQQKQTSIEVMALSAMELDITSFSCDVLPGNQCISIGDHQTSTKDKGTIKNIGNTPLELGLEVFDLGYGQARIQRENIDYAFSANIADLKPSSSIYSLNKASLDFNSSLPLSIRINVPQAASKGNYSGKISLVVLG